MMEAPSMELLHELLAANTKQPLPAYGDTAKPDEIPAITPGMVKLALRKLWEHKLYIALGFAGSVAVMTAAGFVIYKRSRR